MQPTLTPLASTTESSAVLLLRNTYGYSPRHVRLQPPSDTVIPTLTYCYILNCAWYSCELRLFSAAARKQMRSE